METIRFQHLYSEHKLQLMPTHAAHNDQTTESRLQNHFMKCKNTTKQLFINWKIINTPTDQFLRLPRRWIPRPERWPG